MPAAMAETEETVKSEKPPAGIPAGGFLVVADISFFCDLPHIFAVKLHIFWHLFTCWHKQKHEKHFAINQLSGRRTAALRHCERSEAI